MTDENADSGRPSTVVEDANQMAARIAPKLREAGLKNQILYPVTADTAVLRQDRIVVVLALTMLTALAWSYLLWLSHAMVMDDMAMDDFRMIPFGMGLMMPAQMPWRAMEFAFLFAMWTVMMVGMMTPWAAPMILTYARVGRHAKPQSTPLTATIWFVGSFFVPWIIFGLFATVVQWALDRAGLLDSGMASTSNVLGGLLLFAAGTYQCTGIKALCLGQCQSSFAFLMRHGGFPHDASDCVMLGLRYGAYCVGSCWLLMLLLFVGGVMNLPWIVLLTLLIILEKVGSSGHLIADLLGAVLIAAGAWLLATGVS
jgi:predicted metal-binding membrane protein